jgi:hypothetical protein
MTMETDSFLQQAFADDHLQIIASGRTEKIRYVAVNVVEKWSDPEEKIRATYYAELIYRYGYKSECIGVEVIPCPTVSRWIVLISWFSAIKSESSPLVSSSVNATLFLIPSSSKPWSKSSATATLINSAIHGAA